LTVKIPPSITQQPVGDFVLAGTAVTLSVTAAGTEPLEYQWRKDGDVIPGANDAALVFDAVEVADSGSYTVTVSNAYGSVSSQAAVLRVIEPPEYRLYASSAGGGMVLSDPYLQNYASNATVRVSVFAAGGWTFLDWLGDLDGTNPEMTLVMNADRCVEARFGTELPASATVNGTIERIPESAMYPAGCTVQFRALPAAGYYFANWTGSFSGTANPANYTVESAFLTVGASFKPLPEGQVSLVVLPEGKGQVTVDPMGNRHTAGTVVTLKAVPSPDQEFLGWEGDASGTENPLLAMLDGSKLVRAKFTVRPRLDAWTCGGPLHDGGALVLLSGEWGKVYRIDVSEDLQTWKEHVTLTNVLGVTQFRDPAASGPVPRFYRAEEVR